MIEIDPFEPVDGSEILYLFGLLDAVVLEIDALDCWMEHEI